MHNIIIDLFEREVLNKMYKKIKYGLGNLSYSVIGQTVSNFFMFFATSVLGLSGTLVGTAIAISTLWDGISDTIIGYLSDNRSILSMGRRNGYMLLATLGMSICNILLWFVPSGISSSLKFVWILVSLLLLETFNTTFSTPYMALGNELATDYHDRTKINATSTIFFLIGIIVPSVLMVIFLPSTETYPIGQLNPVGYKNIALVTSTICLLCGLISTFGTLRYVNKRKYKRKTKFKFSVLVKNFSSAFRDKRLNKIILGYVLTSCATVFLSSVGLHFFTYSMFLKSKQITLLLVTLLFGTIVSQPIWVSISHKLKKKTALTLGIIMTILSVFFVILIFIFRVEWYDFSYYMLILAIFLCGLGSGALYSLPSSMYGDAIMSRKSTSAKVASFSGAMTFAGNIANSSTQLLVGILLDFVGFDGGNVTQTLGVQTGLALILFVGVEVALILSGLVFSRYKEPIKDSENQLI